MSNDHEARRDGRALAFGLGCGGGDQLTEDAPGGSSSPAHQLFEAACDIDIDMRGALAQVEVRQRFVNPGPTEMAATYEFDLPRGATVTSFTFKGERGAEQALALPGVFTTVGIDARPVIGIDRRPRDPRERRAGSGFTRTLIHKGIPAKLVLTGHGDSAIKIRKSARSASAPSRR